MCMCLLEGAVACLHGHLCFEGGDTLDLFLNSEGTICKLPKTISNSTSLFHPLSSHPDLFSSVFL